jgi:tetratricopeptide (TPR) repeat protein
MPHRPDLPSRTWRPETVLRPRYRLGLGVCLTVLMILAVGAHLGGLRGTFVLGDGERIEAIRQSAAGGWRAFFATPVSPSMGDAPLSPLARLSLIGDYRDDTGGATALRGTNVLLHAIATVLLFALALQLGAARPVALAAAALFAVHPVHAEALAWSAGRGAVLGAVWSLVALACYARSHAARSIGWFVTAVLAAVLACLSHRATAALPFELLAIDVLGLSYGRGPRRLVTGGMWGEGWRGRALRLLPFTVLFLVQVIWIGAGHRSGMADFATRWSYLDMLGTGARAFCRDLGILIAPLRLRPLEFIDRVHPPWSLWFWAGAALATFLIVAALKSRRRTPVLAASLFILWIASLGLALVSRTSFAADRLRYATADLYLPSIGLSLGLASLAWELARRLGARRQQAFAAGMAFLTGTATVRTLARVPEWRSDDSLTEAWALSSPHDPWVLAARASVLRTNGRLDEAQRLLDTALGVLPRDGIAALELARLEIEAGRLEAAVMAYGQAVAVLPGLREARLGLAKTLRQLGRLPEAAQQYEILAARFPHDVEILVNEGELRLSTNQLDAAERSFQAALLVDPHRKEALYDRAVVALRRDDLAAAVQYADRALDVDPYYFEARMLLGGVAARQQRWMDAASEFERALALDDTKVEARVNLGAALLDGGNPTRAAEVLEKAVRQSPSVFAWVNLAHAQWRCGRSIDAERSFRAALQIERDSDLARRGLGLLLASQPGRDDDARTVLVPFVAENPQDDEASAALHKLGIRH